MDHTQEQGHTMRCLPALAALGLALLSPPTLAEQKQLGRLFFTPEQRLQFDLGKFQDGTGAAPDSLALNGILQRQGGARTAWINGVPQKMGHSDENNPASVPVSVPNRAQAITVKVGQKINVPAANVNSR